MKFLIFSIWYIYILYYINMFSNHKIIWEPFNCSLLLNKVYLRIHENGHEIKIKRFREYISKCVPIFEALFDTCTAY